MFSKYLVSVHWTPRPMSTPTHDDRWQNLPRPLSSHFSLRHPPSLGLRVKSLIDCWPHCPQNETFLNINHRLAWYSLLGQYHPRQFHSLYEKVQFFINRPSPFLYVMATQEPIDFGSVIPVVSVSWYRTKQCWDSQEHSTVFKVLKQLKQLVLARVYNVHCTQVVEWNAHIWYFYKSRLRGSKEWYIWRPRSQQKIQSDTWSECTAVVT